MKSFFKDTIITFAPPSLIVYPSWDEINLLGKGVYLGLGCIYLGVRIVIAILNHRRKHKDD